MKRIRRIFTVLTAFILIVGIIITISGVWFVQRSWPQVDGTISAPGLQEEVTVIRDQWGIPYIYAENEHDLFFAQGYVHAQDRLWQMEFNRRVGSGTLSAVLGEVTLGVDRLMRIFGLRRAAERDWEILDTDSRAILEAYAQGVNTYIDTHPNALPIEFTILDVTPEPWHPVDTLTWGKVMSLNLAGDYGLDLLRARAIVATDFQATQDILPFPEEDFTIPAEVDNFRWLAPTRNTPGDAAVETMVKKTYSAIGSNSWVVHGNRTATGKPLLAVDNHLPFGVPSIWYQNGLFGGRFNVVGFSFPGVPMILMGHNEHIGWGITNLSTEVQDLYIEKLDNRDNPTQYLFEDEWHDLEIVEEVIEVNNQDSVTLPVYITRHGPIINALLGELENAEPLALRWPDLEDSTLVTSIMLLNQASNWQEFRQALQYWSSPKQNFVYVDVDGNIGYQAASNIPIRVPGHNGIVPVPGWTGEYEWEGYIAFDDLPSHFNPSAEFIIAANTRVIPPDTSQYTLEYSGVTTFRAERIEDFLTSHSNITVEDIQGLQMDTYSVQAEVLRPYLLQLEPENDLQEQALSQVDQWDLYYEIDQTGASIYEVWHWFLQQNIFSDELGEDLMQEYYRFGLATAPVLIDLMEEPENEWFDDITTEQIETRDDIVRQSFVDALQWLTERYGDQPEEWNWGRIHTMTFFHQPLGQSGIALIENIFNSDAMPARGSDFTINNGWYSIVTPFTMEGGTIQRLIIDVHTMSNTALAINATGQSEHIFHRHRMDMVDMWQNGQYHDLLFDQAQIMTNAESRLTLRP